MSFRTSRPAMLKGPGVLILVAVILAIAVPGFSQTPPAGSSRPPGEYATIEINPFGGYQWFQVFDKKSAMPSELEPRPVVGFRVTEDVWRRVGLEQSFTAGFNDLRLRPFGSDQKVDANARNYTLAFNPVFHFTSRESKVRPFVTGGGGITWYVPTDEAPKIGPRTDVIAPVYDLQTKWGPSVNYGVGIKINVSRRFGLRFDARGMWTQGIHFGLPREPSAPGSVYSAEHNSENAIAVTGGFTLRFGHRSDYVPPPPPAPPPPPPPVADIRISGVSGAHDVCPGEDVRLEVAATGWLPDQTPAYQWMVNGQPVSGANAATFSVPTTASGPKTVTVQVSVPGSSKTSDPVTVGVKDYSAPVVSFPLSPTTIPFGAKAPLNATAKASECGGATNLRYTASDGVVSGSTFDSSSLAFDTSNRLRQQTRAVRLTATATDQKGGTGSVTADLTVTLSPEARRLDDIVFPANSARVNNCAKRLLLEQLTPMLRQDPDATVILIGHRDERERGRAASTLDRTRVLNGAAVLSAGTGICPQLELSRVKTGWVGTDQTSPAKPQFCGGSTDVNERGGQAVRAADQRAQFRRVEVWIVPGGAEMPAGVTGLQDLPAADVKKLGCPK